MLELLLRLLLTTTDAVLLRLQILCIFAQLTNQQIARVGFGHSEY